MVLPAQAMACMISGLEPASVTQGWNPSDGTLLAETVANKVLHAVVKVCLPSWYCARVVNAPALHSLSFIISFSALTPLEERQKWHLTCNSFWKFAFGFS